MDRVRTLSSTHPHTLYVTQMCVHNPQVQHFSIDYDLDNRACRRSQRCIPFDLLSQPLFRDNVLRVPN